jgi:glycosyltransferase involved in cell wall biosynthesis
MESISDMPDLFEPSLNVSLMLVVTSHVSVDLLRGQLKYFRKEGFDVSVVSSPGPQLDAAAKSEGVKAIAVPLSREVSPLMDLAALWKLWRLMRSVRPTITMVSTPKAGLLGGIAAYLSGVPCRFYMLRGLRCETAVGWKRRYLLLAERLACCCAQRIVCVSPSLRDLALQYRLASEEKLVALAPGSSNGVAVDRFTPTQERLFQASTLRAKMNIPLDSPVMGFVGRLTRDKGICELLEAYRRLRASHVDLYLLLVGSFEDGDPVPADLREFAEKDPRIVLTGEVRDTALYYHVMDALVLPTHREGFPNVVLEAHAAAKPVVTTYATGARDAAQNGVNGILLPVGDVEALVLALHELVHCPDSGRRMGKAGHERVRENFPQELVWSSLNTYLTSFLKERGLPVPSVIGNGTVKPSFI